MRWRTISTSSSALSPAASAVTVSRAPGSTLTRARSVPVIRGQLSRFGSGTTGSPELQPQAGVGCGRDRRTGRDLVRVDHERHASVLAGMQPDGRLLEAQRAGQRRIASGGEGSEGSDGSCAERCVRGRPAALEAGATRRVERAAQRVVERAQPDLVARLHRAPRADQPSWPASVVSCAARPERITRPPSRVARDGLSGIGPPPGGTITRARTPAAISISSSVSSGRSGSGSGSGSVNLASYATDARLVGLQFLGSRQRRNGTHVSSIGTANGRHRPSSTRCGETLRGLELHGGLAGSGYTIHIYAPSIPHQRYA